MAALVVTIGMLGRSVGSAISGAMVRPRILFMRDH
jgi:hypothetical protein